MTKPLPPGRAAEERVASLYRGLRFDAERDVRIGGKQWDVVATKREAGVGDLTVLIEVKDHPGASTPIQEVRDFANTASIALSQGHGTSAFFVTTGALTRDSGAVVAGLPNVNLIEFADLERQLFDPTGALQRWQLAYKSKPVNHRYVDLQATLFDISSNELGDFPGHVPATGLLGLATSSPSACVVIFGDYGSGKTTILQRLFSAAIEQTSIHRDAPFPVLLRLREFEQPYDIGDFVLRALRRDLGISDLASSLLWEFVEAGRLIFMFDGFDEITLRADDAVRADLMARLSPLLFSPCPALLTTRPGYFASWEEYRGLIRRSAGSSAVARASDPGSQRVDDLIERLTARFVDASPTTARAAQVIEYQLDPLTSDQVDEYLESARDELGETEPQEVRAFLDKVYDLSELITRPIILEMAVGTIAEGKIDVSKGTLANGAAGLYEAYARTHLNRDVANVPSRRDVLSPDDRLRFAEECASEMLRLDVLELAPETSRRLAQRILGESNEYNIDEALTDLRTCSFLTISVDGTLEFIHRSYQEFFLARRLRDELRAGRRRLLYEPLRWEYLYFLGAFGYTDNDFYNELVEISRTEVEADATAANNAAVAVLAARETATSLRWHDRVLDGVRTRSTRIQDSDLTNVSLAAKSIDELRIGGSKLDLRLTAGDYGALNLEDCTGSLVTKVPIPELGVVGGDLRVTASESPLRLTLVSASVSLRVSTGRPTMASIRDTHGSIRVTNGSDSWTVDVERSRLALDPGPITGAITNSVIETPVDGFDGLSATIKRSTVLVRGSRSSALGDARKRGPRARGDAEGRDLIVVLDPTVPIDGWWKRQLHTVTFGGQIRARSGAVDGLTVRRVQTKSADRAFLRVHQLSPGRLVLEGDGADFTEAVRAFRSTVDRLTLLRLQVDGELVAAINAMLHDLGVDPLTAELVAMVSDLESSRLAGVD